VFITQVQSCFPLVVWTIGPVAIVVATVRQSSTYVARCPHPVTPRVRESSSTTLIEPSGQLKSKAARRRSCSIVAATQADEEIEIAISETTRRRMSDRLPSPAPASQPCDRAQPPIAQNAS
jgi:hypothetical protein